MNCIRYGPQAFLVQFAERIGDESFALSRALIAELERQPLPGLREFVPGYVNLLLEFDPDNTPELSTVASELSARLSAAALVSLPPAPVKEIPVRYDGPDLARVGESHRLTTKEICEIHAGTIYKVYLLGFSPGFPYLGDLDPRLHTPRLASPRPRVPAGSVAIGGEHTGIYSVESPGGWNVIGRTRARMFDSSRVGTDGNRAAMFLLKPGDRVRFVPE